MLVILIVIVGIVAFAITLTVLALSSKDHSEYDWPRPADAGQHGDESAAHKQFVKLILADQAKTPKLGRKAMLARMRQQMDARGDAVQINSDIQPATFEGMNAEWIIAPNASPNRRLLYFHGGAYMVGSAKSHRLITSRLSEVSKAAVLAIDYRLMPEHSRLAGLKDCQKAYDWILENGPEASSKADILIIAGDSSGGNLALATVAWARDSRRRAADAVVAMSPQTDLTLASPSLITNIKTDIMQGASFGPIVKAPKVIRFGFSYLMHKVIPSNPIVSPLLGDLSNLPPTLIQVSNAEMFLDDAVRYVNKATAHDSKASLQTWPFAMHVWQAFPVPEADAAFAEIGAFIMAQTSNP